MQFNTIDIRLIPATTIDEHMRTYHRNFLAEWRAGKNYPYVILLNGAQAGFAGVGIDHTTQEFYLQHLAVQPEFRRGGVGRAVVEQLFGRFAGWWRVDVAGEVGFWRRVIPEYARVHRLDLEAWPSYRFMRGVNIELPAMAEPILHDNELELVLLRRTPGNPLRMLIPVYEFAIRAHGMNVGHIDLRIGNSYSIITYGGHIGYGIDQAYRGHHYALRACRLLLPLARTSGMDTLWITANPPNLPSRRTIEHLGARLVDIFKLPTDSDQYLHGEREKCRYRLELGR